MTQEYISITFWQLGGALLFVGVSAVASLYYSLRLERDLALGTFRTFAQLFAMGYLLEILFGLESAALVLAVYLGMTFMSVRIIQGRVKEKTIDYFAPTAFSVMFSYTLVTMVVTSFVVGADPWWDPQYFIPIGGMVAGNSMNALAIALDRFFSELRTKRAEVEMMLCHGADYVEASRAVFTNALKAGMIPSINSMMGVGIVFIPGMMTGQILAGADPAEAVRYQIVVMLMLVASTALGAVIVLNLVRKRCFGQAMQLVIGSGGSGKNIRK